ncbi:molybdenum cofactor biosynthesis protein MoaE [Entomobacter blattae]|uniref:Molybdopterin synthase catalytic subunit n=1 Tax=Entomobacter blattae TaxID=2762277 RepID=A0A7H1NSD9_9PROT|nr:molybdenum cofactor biosynthesis protein MoaE [Entomobacter blattae]QNT78699.1 Molybdopterin synthase catalytic subunit [Entomobacter blattae]
MLKITVQYEDFDLNHEQAELLERCQHVGAVTAFTGLVRQDRDDRRTVKSLILQHYPGMTENHMRMAAEQAVKQFSLLGCTLIHRVGELGSGDQIVLVLTVSSHRKASLSATEFLIDWLKTEVPIWKKQVFTDGSEQWVEARKSDHAITQNWKDSLF